MAQIFQSAQFWTVVIFAIVSLALCVNLYWMKSASPPIYFAYGLALIGIALVLVFVLGGMNAAAKSRLSAREYELFSIQFQAALYVFPFISAAVGTNLISHAIVESKRR